MLGWIKTLLLSFICRLSTIYDVYRCQVVKGWTYDSSFLCVNFTGLKNDQIAGETFFLGMSVRLFLKEINILISRLSKGDCLHHCGQASSNPLAWIEHKGGGRVNSFSSWAGTLFFPSLGQQSSQFLGLQTLGLNTSGPYQVLGSSNLDWIIAFLRL